MVSRRERALCAGGALLEAAAVAAALRGDVHWALSAHAGGCLGLSLGLGRCLVRGRAGWTLLLGLALFVPVLGGLGLLATALLGAAQAPPPAPDLVRTPVPGAPAGPAPSGLALEPIASWPRAVRVAAARGRNDPGAIATLRRAIGDPDEDVRLVAYSVLESKSRAADRRIHQVEEALEEAPPERRGPLLRRLAAEHWEQAWLGLVQGEGLSRALEKARRYCLWALEDEVRRAQVCLLLGRVELRMGRPERAEAALERAEALGMPARAVRPYRAEAAFLARRFGEVRAHLAAIPRTASPTVERVRRFWS